MCWSFLLISIWWWLVFNGAPVCFCVFVVVLVLWVLLGRGDNNIIGTGDSETFEVVDFDFDLDSETTGENTTLRVHVPANATGKL